MVEIPRGSVYGLLGPNGAGKTTLIRTINRITLPDEGRILFEGTPEVLAENPVVREKYLGRDFVLRKREFQLDDR